MANYSNLIWCTISELSIVNTDIPLSVADKLICYHIAPMTKVREKLGKPIYASQRSGYRPKWYEIQRGRSGNSQHTFEDLGAIDWTTSGDLNKLLALIIEHTNYTRICYYPNNGFIHCDYKNKLERWVYECESPTSKWKRVEKIA
jgi:uncharacterized protein YcbK (DUF882 family)